MSHLLVWLILAAEPMAQAAPPHIERYLERSAALARSPGAAQLAPLPLPPSKDDLGIFVPARPKLPKSVDVLEIVDGDEAIVRAWHFPPGVSASEGTEDDVTFVDLWIEGIDTSRLSANMPAELKQVFHVTGSKLFDTACGKRSLPLLVPIDIEPCRKPGK
jgi:hypothetical protein